MSEVLKRRLAVLALLVAYFGSRYRLVFNLDAPLVGWRPADMASIALNYARNGFHFLYPQVSWGGAGPGYVEMEFPLAPFLNGILFGIFGFHESLCLVIPLLSGLGIVWFTYRIADRLFGQAAGLTAGLVAALSPTLRTMTTTGLYADPPMIFFGVMSVFHAMRWADEGRRVDLVLATAALALASLLKLTALFLVLPLLVLLIKRYGARWWRTPTTWLAALAIALPSVLWYGHAYRLAVEYGNTFGILWTGFSKWGTASLLGQPSFYRVAAGKIALYHLTPVAAVGFVCGVVLTLRRRDLLMAIWLAACAVYVMVTATGVYFGHYHYLLPVLPMAAILSGRGLVWLVTSIADRTGLNTPQALARFAIAAGLVFASSEAWASQRFAARDWAPVADLSSKKKRTGLLVKDVTRPGSLIIVVDTQMDAYRPEQSMTPPEVFYFGARRGWYLSLAWLTEERIERLRSDGAAYLVISSQSVPDFRERQADLFQSLSRRYRVVMNDDHRGIVIDLASPPRAP